MLKQVQHDVFYGSVISGIGINIDVKENDLEFVHIVHNLGDVQERFDIFFRVKQYGRELKNNEPDKHKEIRFFDYDDLPSRDKMSDTTLQALAGMRGGIAYSERRFVEDNQGCNFLQN